MMKRLIRDSGRTLLMLLLIACAAAIAGLGATVHIFTLQQTNTVAEEIPLLASRTDPSALAAKAEKFPAFWNRWREEEE